jgi:acetoacetate decarboxylase
MMPQSSPLYPDLPYEYTKYKRVSLYGRADEDAIRNLLPEPLNYVSNEFEAFVLHAPEIDGLSSYHEGGIVVSAGYGDIEGAHMLYEYVDDDAAVAAGREYWGYPKKMATVTMTERDGIVDSTISRRGTEILSLSFSEQDIESVSPQLFPRLQVKQIPSADGSGYDVNQIVKMSFEGDDLDFDADGVSHRTTGTGDLVLNSSETDPLNELAPLEVTGGAVTNGSFTLGTGEVVADLNQGDQTDA